MGNGTVAILACCLICLLLLLLFLYKKLNREADGEYTIRRIIYKEGGVRDQVRGAVTAVETGLGIQLWPHSDEGEEMKSIEEGQADSSHEGEDSNGEDDEDEDNEDQSGSSKEEEDGNKSCSDSSEAGEQNRLMSEPEEGDEMEEKMEEKQEQQGKEQGKAETSGMKIDLKQFSGSVIWSEEGGEGHTSDVTAL